MTTNSTIADDRPRSIAIFDLDRTITRIGTFTPFLLSTRATPLDKAALLASIAPHAGAYRLKSISRTELKNRMLAAALGDLAEDEIAACARRFVDIQLDTGLFDGAVKEICRHKEVCDHLILATAAVDFYASLFAEALGFDTLVATRTEPSSHGPCVIGENCYGDEKRRRVEDAVRDIAGAEIGAIRTVFYTDHHSDYPLMAKVNEAIAVNPGPKMRALAAKQSYQTLHWKDIHQRSPQWTQRK